ncbi:FixJ family two-component response regulator [Hydrogenophaga palleronii]|uniref:FixJ family two-component response regulator n=1 Tax=Hydrogenophaga palleronii TaxID=65655 RepID=A0ABU1WR03_9BURK|nr:response regulator [Hydrogenophaga palleronii]MDR7151479.1 FixJ family two-component response regulator [Hydrogenophaga palleronii]
MPHASSLLEQSRVTVGLHFCEQGKLEVVAIHPALHGFTDWFARANGSATDRSFEARLFDLNRLNPQPSISAGALDTRCVNRARLHAHPQPAATSAATSTDFMPETPLVLIVDDDVFMRSLLCRVLVAAGMSVASFGSAAELLREGDLKTASVLLLDLRMPEMSGMELHQLLQRRGVNLPVLFISGEADLATAVTAMRNGAADFIEKPFQGALLVESVRRAVARHADRTTPPKPVADPHFLACLEALTSREREVFDLLVTGMSSKLIARELGGSFRTIESHRAQVMRKMTARHLPDLVRMSIESVAPR